jgi:hypothetical protein
VKLHLVADGSSGLLVLPDDADRLAESMQVVLTDHEPAEQAQPRRQIPRLAIDTAAVVPEVVQVYESMVSM